MRERRARRIGRTADRRYPLGFAIMAAVLAACGSSSSGVVDGMTGGADAATFDAAVAAGLDAARTVDAAASDAPGVTDAAAADAPQAAADGPRGDAPGADTSPPVVVSVLPLADATQVSRSTPVTATFSEALDASTVTPSTVKLSTTSGGQLVAGSVSQSGTTVIFTPSAPLDAATSYTATVTTGITDLAGNPLAADVTWSFTTAVAGDTVSPTVVGRDPVSQATGVATSTSITAVFSEALDASTVTTGTVTLAPTAGGAAVSGAVALIGTTVTFTPGSLLAAATSYTVTLTAGITDLAGNPLAADVTWSFTTALVPDVTAPTVLTRDPDSGASDVSPGTTVTVTFSEVLRASSVSTTSVRLTRSGGAAVAGTVELSGATVSFRPSTTLAESTQYTVTLTTGITDASGNPLASDLSWSFTTADQTPPAVLQHSPPADATGVARTATISATFSEELDAATVNAGTVTVSVTGGDAVAGTVTLDGATVTFDPSVTLANQTSYTVTLLTGIADLQGNPLAAAFTWSFETADTEAPSVLSFGPTGSGVSTTTAIAATLSEAVAPGSVTPSTFTVTGASGALSVDGATVTFTPSVPLAEGTTYTVTLGTGITDLAGNPLAQATSWSFTTSSTPDQTAPRFLSSSPAENATDVAATTLISVTFDEPVLAPPGSLTVSYGPDPGTPVGGTLSVLGNVVSFDPTSDLELCTTFNVKITTAITDLSGNHLAADRQWSFTTTSGPELAAPTLTGTPRTSAAALSWTVVSGASMYRVYRGAAAVLSSAAHVWVDSNLTNGTAYSYTVEATNRCRTSPRSSAVVVVPKWGLSWTNRTPPFSQGDLRAVARRGTMVRIGGALAGYTQWTKTDGQTWTTEVLDEASDGEGASFLSGMAVSSDGSWMALVNGGHVEVAAGTGAWVNPHPEWPTGDALHGITSNVSGGFFTVGAETKIAATGDRGATWGVIHWESGGTALRAVASHDFAPIVAVGDGGLVTRGLWAYNPAGPYWYWFWCSNRANWATWVPPVLVYCTDAGQGRYLSPTTPAQVTAHLRGVAFGNGRWVAVGDAGTILYSDDDGLTWSKTTSGVTNDLYAVTYGPGGFLAVGTGGTVIISGYGLAPWTKGTSGTSATLFAVSPPDGSTSKFMAVGQDGLVLSSP